MNSAKNLDSALLRCEELLYAEFGGCYQARPKISLLWRKNEAENFFTVANLPDLNSIDVKAYWSIIQYYKSVFGIIKISKPSLHG